MKHRTELKNDLLAMQRQVVAMLEHLNKIGEKPLTVLDARVLCDFDDELEEIGLSISDKVVQMRNEKLVSQTESPAP